MATTAPSPDLAPAPAPPITRIHRLSFGFGAVANGVKNAAFSTYLLLFYNQVLGVPGSQIGLALFAIYYQRRDQESYDLMQKYKNHKDENVKKYALQSIESLEKHYLKDKKK